jgi:hypothetical protein
MKKFIQVLLVAGIMLIGILGITNPGHKLYKMFDGVEGKLIHNYFIYSVYQQYASFTVSKDGKSRIYRRYIGIAMDYYEISPLVEEIEPPSPTQPELK